ncbi:hypothetical protein BAY59_38420 (plasmid) [Prauserella coralliicola]|nr:hypothetical protein BAY59_38420 [Prauserella coralliicola]
MVLEAPESVALLLYSCWHTQDQTGADSLHAALSAAAEVAAEALARHYVVAEVVLHDFTDADRELPRPHAHLITRGRVDYAAFEGWARYAHVRYQAELQARLLALSIGVTRDYPSPHGWEITGAIPHLGQLTRQACGPALYPLEAEQAAAQRRSAS